MYKMYILVFTKKIHTYYSRFIPEGVAEAYSTETPTSFQNYLAMSNTADVTGSKPIAI
jgi:hypothetical protein